MRSAVKNLINNMVSTIGTVTATAPDSSSVNFTAYTSVPSNAGERYILVRHNASEAIPVKDRYMETGSINVMIVDQTREDSASDTLIYSAKTQVENALAPSLYFRPSSISNGETIDFRKGTEQYEETLIDGVGKVKTITIQVLYTLEYVGATS